MDILNVPLIAVFPPNLPGVFGRTSTTGRWMRTWSPSKSTGHSPQARTVPGAVGRLAWTFLEAGSGVTITQRCTLEGGETGAFAQAMGPSLEAGIPAGMRKLCEAMENAQAASAGSSH
jgi:hypothetical protein